MDEVGRAARSKRKRNTIERIPAPLVPLAALAEKFQEVPMRREEPEARAGCVLFEEAEAFGSEREKRIGLRAP